MDVPLETLAAADQFYGALLLDERGKYAEARVVAEQARTKIYTPESLSCSDTQVVKAIDLFASSAGPIVDLASGMGYLVEEMAKNSFNPSSLQISVSEYCGASIEI